MMTFSCLDVLENAGHREAKRVGDEIYFLCPFHDDSAPSLRVNAQKDVFHCFPCGTGGNAWELAARFAGVNAADKAGVKKWLVEHGLSDGSGRSQPEQLTEYVYTDEEGRPSFRVVRADYKKFFQQTPNGSGGWVNGLGEKKPVLYALDRIKDEDRVFVVEGEKDADSLWDRDLPATTNPMGAGKWRSDYNSCLAGKEVVILPDNDQPGRDHAEQVAEQLTPVAASVRILNLPDLQDKGDVSDWLEAGGTVEKLEKLAGEVEPLKEAPGCGDSSEWLPPIDLYSRNLTEFPVQALPSWLREYVEAEAHATQTPLGLAAMLILSVVAAIVAGKAELEIRAGWKEPLNIYTVTVLPSGSRKTTVFRHATAPLYQYEKEVQSRLAPEVARSQSEFKLLEQTCRQLRAKAAKEEGAAEKKELKRLLDKDVVKLSRYQLLHSPVLVVDDCSPEKLANLLAQQGGRLALLSAEGDIFELMAGRYSKGQPNFGVFLKGHSGDPLRVDRINRPTDEVSSPALTVGLTIQPDVLHSLTQKPGFRGRGLLARFLYSVPPSNIGKRLVGAPPVPSEIRSRFEGKVLALARLFEPVETTHVLRLSPEASETLRAFEEKVEGLLADGQELGELKDWGGKLVGAVARIAGILHFASRVGDKDPWAQPVDESTVVSAIRIGVHLKEEAQTAFQRMRADPAVEGAQKVLRWIEREEKSEFSKRDLHQALRSSFHRVEELDRPLRRVPLSTA